MLSREYINARAGTTILVMLLALVLVALSLSLVSSQAQADTDGGLIVQDLSGPLTPTDLANQLVGAGISVSNVTYTGTLDAAGNFTGGTAIVGFENGIILSTGSASNVVGPNVFDNISTDHFTPGDPDLTALAGFATNDAAILEFDFIPTESGVAFQYVFASDEYNEFVNSQFNDVFAFFVNGVNCAVLGADPVSINTVNNGNPFGMPPVSNPQLYINNDLQDGGGAINTEMDGLTKVLTCNAFVNPGVTNHIKLAIADTSDWSWDTNVFLKSGSFISFLPPRSYLPVIQK